ncbi:MAG: endonuclease domain-containing protein [Lacibacter sp.]
MQTSEHHHYNKNLRHYARELRGNMTKAEAVLWKHVLRAGMMKGYTFNRQRPVLNFIADFMCKDLKLVIEVDGITHHEESTVIRDELKDKALKAAGFYVMRFSDNEVLNGLEGVRRSILSWIEENENG